MSRHRSATDYTMQVEQLPAFADGLLKKETELEQNCSIEIINELTQLYAQVIEYYEDKNDPRYITYKERMQQMFIQPQVLLIMTGNSESYKAVAAKDESILLKRQMSLDSVYKSFRSDKIIANNRSNAQRSSRCVVQDRANQNQKLEERLRTRSMSRERKAQTFQSKIAAGVRRSQKRQSTLGDISKSWEEHFEKMTQVVSDIQLQYGMKIRALECKLELESELESHGQIKTEIDQIKSKMNQKIHNKKDEIEKHRKFSENLIRAQHRQGKPHNQRYQ